MNKEKRFYYTTTGYGVFSLLGNKYSAGRIELYDTQSDSPYAIKEFGYWVPHDVITPFREFWDFLETDYPLHMNMDMFDRGKELVAEEFGVSVDDLLNNKDVIKAFYDKENEGKMENFEKSVKKWREENE